MGVKTVDLVSNKQFKKYQRFLLLIFLIYITNCKRNLNQFIRLIANIYQHKADNIILPNNTLRVPLKTRCPCSIFLG